MIRRNLFTSRLYATESHRIAQMLKVCYSTWQESSGVADRLMVILPCGHPATAVQDQTKYDMRT